MAVTREFGFHVFTFPTSFCLIYSLVRLVYSNVFFFNYFWQTFIFTATMSKNFREKYYHERLYGFLKQYAETSINLETVKVPNGYKSTLFVYGESSISHTHSKRSNQKKMFYFNTLTVLLSKNSWLGNLIYLYFFYYYSNNNFLFE